MTKTKQRNRLKKNTSTIYRKFKKKKRNSCEFHLFTNNLAEVISIPFLLSFPNYHEGIGMTLSTY